MACHLFVGMVKTKSFDTLTEARKEAYKLVKKGTTEVTIETPNGNRHLFLEKDKVWEHSMMNPLIRITAKGTPAKKKAKKEKLPFGL